MTIQGTIVSSGYRSLSEAYAELKARPKAPKSLHMKPIIAWMTMALSVLIMAYSGLFSLAPILVFYALWLPQLGLKGLKVAHPSRDAIACLAMPLLACASALWSGQKFLTLYQGIEYFSMGVCALIMARMIPAQSWLKGLSAGAAVALIITLINGRYGQDYFSGTYSLIGLFGSKNQVGYMAQIGTLAACALLFSKTRRLDKLIFALGPIAVFTVSLYLSRSSTSVLSLILTMAIISMTWCITRFPQRMRRIMLAMVLLILAAVSWLALSQGAADLVLQTAGKDATLTGRTYLWSEGIGIGWERPLLGHGYNSFWVQGEPRAERYWYEFLVTNRGGFHFHSTFVQVFVDLGVIGLIVVAGLMLGNIFSCFRAVLREGMDMEPMFLLAVSWMFLLRAFVEVDILSPFGMGPLLFFAIRPKLAAYLKAKDQPV